MKQHMRIAVLAPPWFELPPTAYGGIEWICYWIVEGLVKLGHEVTLIGAGTSRTSGRFIQTLPSAPFERVGEGLPEALHLAKAAKHLCDLKPDVIHDNTCAGPLLSLGSQIPTVVTAHGSLEGELGELYRSLGESIHLVAISDRQRQLQPDLPWAGRVYNGIPVAEYPFAAKKEDYALFLGRMSASKGAHLAIEAARAAGIPLVIAAKLNEKSEKDYFEAEVAPRLGPGITWIGEADTERKKELLVHARCLVCPIQWEEPFGLVMAEAMACGTPVVALQNGAAPELVLHGETGFLCQKPDELAGALEAVDALTPQVCRNHVSRNFDVRNMVSGYDRLFRALLDSDRQHLSLAKNA